MFLFKHFCSTLINANDNRIDFACPTVSRTVSCPSTVHSSPIHSRKHQSEYRKKIFLLLLMITQKPQAGGFVILGFEVLADMSDEPEHNPPSREF